MPEIELYKFGSTSKAKGSVKIKGEINGELVEKGKNTPVKIAATANKGVKGEIEIAKQKGDQLGNETLRKLAQELHVKEIKETANFEFSGKKVDVSAGVSAKIETPWPWLTGTVGFKFTVAGVEWEKLKKDPDDITVGGGELQGGLQGDGNLPLTDSYELKLSVKGVLSGSVKPNWPVILAEGAKKAAQEGVKTVAKEGAKQVAKQGAESAATGAAEGLVVDTAAVASAAAAIALPLATAAAIGYGMYQESKNMKADAEAIQTGLSTRKRATTAAESFARVITGSRNSGDEGAQAAEGEINRIMSETHATREQVIEAVKQAQGGYQAIRDAQLKRLKDKIYDDACRTFDEAHKKDFGFLERQGETWGFRGSYRKMLRLILYADD